MADKRSKDSVAYQDHPSGTAQCSRCRHFVPPQACEGVAGKISSQGWCVRFRKLGEWYGRSRR